MSQSQMTPREYHIRTLEMRAEMGGPSAGRAARELEDLLDSEAETVRENESRFREEGW